MNCHLMTFLIAVAVAIVLSTADAANERVVVKRQAPRSPQRSIPLSRSRQFPPPEELDESNIPENEDDITTSSPAVPSFKRPTSRFRGRQQADPPEEIDEISPKEEPVITTPATTKATPTPGRPSFGRPGGRSRLQAQTPKPSPITTSKPTPAPANSESNSRVRSTLSSRADIGLDIINKPPPARSQIKPRASSSSRQAVVEDPNADVPTRRTERVRTRVRQRARSTSTTTTTTTTTTAAPLPEEYYYYYEDEEDAVQKQQLATTTTSTTTTTTARPASLPRKPSTGRRPANPRLSSNARTTSKPAPKAAVKFDPESQFQPPPDDVEPEVITERSTRKFTTSTTAAPGPGGIPPHLSGKYKPREDGRFIDFLRDPNRPRELKGFDLSDYPFYVTVPDDIVFDCDDKKDGYYASVPHHCQLFHYCFAGSRYDFLCANYTLYDQTTFTCRFANNVDCASSASFYYRNDDLWKETTTAAPEKSTRKPKAKDDDYEDEEYDDDYDYEEEEVERRRRPKTRRNRQRKDRRKSS